MSDEEFVARFGRLALWLNPPYTPFNRLIVFIDCIREEPPLSAIFLECGHRIYVEGQLAALVQCEGKVFCRLCQIAAN